VCIVCIQRQQEEEMNELTSKLAIKEKEIINLKDNEKQLCKRISESKTPGVKQLETAADKVRSCIHIHIITTTYIHTYTHIYVSRLTSSESQCQVAVCTHRADATTGMLFTCTNAVKFASTVT